MPNTINLDMPNPDEGGSYDTWGDLLDDGRQKTDKAFGSTVEIDTASGTHSLTQDQSNHAVLRFTGALSGNLTVETLAGKSRFWIVQNATNGAHTLTIQVAGGGEAVTVTQGKVALVFANGTDCFALDLSTVAGELPAGYVGSDQILDESVSTPKLADQSVTTDKLGDQAATTPKIADRAVTFEKVQEIAGKQILGNVNADGGPVSEIPIYEVASFAGASASSIPTSLAVQQFVTNTAFSTNLPAQAGNAGKVITTDGEGASWETIEVILGGGLPADSVAESATRVFVTPEQRTEIGQLRTDLGAAVTLASRNAAEAFWLASTM